MEFNLKDDYKSVFGSDAGKRVLDDICDRCGVNRSVFNPDPHVNAYQQGKQRAGFDILEQLEETSNVRPSRSTGSTGRTVPITDADAVDTGRRDKHTHPTHGRYIP